MDWIALPEIGTISQEQVDRLAALHNRSNRRPMRPGKDRVITYTGPRPGDAPAKVVVAIGIPSDF